MRGGFLFTIAKTEQGAGNPSLLVDAPIVLSLHDDLPLTGGCKLHTAGLVFDLSFGDYENHTLTLVAWHEVWHGLPDGDIAPGFGGFRVDVQREDERRD